MRRPFAVESATTERRRSGKLVRMRALLLGLWVLTAGGCVSAKSGVPTMGATVGMAPTRLELAAAMKTVPVVVYVTSWCPVCARARAWLDQHGYAYQPLDVDHDLRAALRLNALNPRGSIPTFDIDGTVLRGFDPDALEDTLVSAALARYRASIKTKP